MSPPSTAFPILQRTTDRPTDRSPRSWILARCGVVALFAIVACRGAGSLYPSTVPRGTTDVTPTGAPLGAALPEDVGVDSTQLSAMTRYIVGSDLPVFSLLISRHDTLIYELYTSSIDRQDAHYLMSATKSVMSALVGIAIDEKLIGGPEESLAEALPPELFGGGAASARFRTVTIKDVLGMSALDAPVAPHQKTPAARERIKLYMSADNRVRFALAQPLLASPGTDFLYTDVTPALAAGLVAYSSHEGVFEFAWKHLFEPMQFQNVEWMHQDRDGIDNGAFGLRLRPVDMQKFGLLFLHHGEWGGRQLISRDWVDRSFSPWIASKKTLSQPDYGWYWWTKSYGSGWTAHMAEGWKGQVIAVFPDQDTVVTMTACIEDGTENSVFRDLMTRFIAPSVHPASMGQAVANPGGDAALAHLLDEANHAPSRITREIERRMIPSVERKERRRSLSFAR